MKEFYESEKTDHAYVTQRVTRIIDNAAACHPRTVLDCGCGRGLILSLLREQLPDARLVGTDISQGSVDQTRNKGFEAEVADVSVHLPFDDEIFDCVVFGELIEHLVDPDAALVQIARVLKTGGTLILTTPNIACWENRILLLFGIQPLFTETSIHTNLGRIFQVTGQWYPTEGHLKVFTLRALLEMLDANGFDIQNVYGTPFLRQPLAAQVDAVISKIPALATNISVVARNRGTRRTHYAKASNERVRAAKWW